MGLYYDKQTRKIFQSDWDLQLLYPRLFVRHEPIPPCVCPKCLEEEKTITYYPCCHCGFQLPPRVPKRPGDWLNQYCPKPNCKGMCDVRVDGFE